MNTIRAKSMSLCLILIVSLSILMCFVYLFVISGAVFSFRTKSKEPQITYGEFPISIVYEVSGEEKRIEDVVICEFAGFENKGSAGVFRNWKSYLKSGNKHIVLLKIDENSELYCWYGSPEYYMDDLRYMSQLEYEENRKKNFFSHFITYGVWENGEFKSKAISADDALEKYGLRIIDVQFGRPIENSFDDTTTPTQRIWACVPDGISKPIEEAHYHVQQE